ncbi:hypothetical protein CCACVL1_14754 [Corchorus capsularis]|uniref:Uncharacterized protein n=1 Tax=Corchorus capsularis TaxID=210143 RepID=A0A1R3I5J3_COCAP|nr:hypothetical protein CCACVL1_14754 [Corchorus capsularis]
MGEKDETLNFGRKSRNRPVCSGTGQNSPVRSRTNSGTKLKVYRSVELTKRNDKAKTVGTDSVNPEKLNVSLRLGLCLCLGRRQSMKTASNQKLLVSKSCIYDIIKRRK